MEYENLFNYDSPPFNPGVRRWAGVVPEQSIVDFSPRPGLNFQTATELPQRIPDHQIHEIEPRSRRRCHGRRRHHGRGLGRKSRRGHRMHPANQEAILEHFGLGPGNMVLTIIIIAILAYLIYHFAKKV